MGLELNSLGTGTSQNVNTIELNKGDLGLDGVEEVSLDQFAIALILKLQQLATVKYRNSDENSSVVVVPNVPQIIAGSPNNIRRDSWTFYLYGEDSVPTINPRSF